jgi:transglutaminase-like putative cysteine protease
VFSYADSYGNAVHHFDVPPPHQRLKIIARSVVETYGRIALPERLGIQEWDLLGAEAVRGECWDFLNQRGLAMPTPALSAFTRERGFDDFRRQDPLTAVQALSAVLYGAFDYETGVTGADSPIDHALAEGRGVCQDFAHIMIAVCRSWGVPARYVSGYLHSDRDAGDRSDPDATHAWVEVFLPSLRWVGLDPTNNVPAGERHLAVAIGRDYADVPPSRGVFKGEAESRLSVGVAVRKAVDGAAEPEFLRMGAPAIAAARRRASSAAVMDQHHQQQ